MKEDHDEIIYLKLKVLIATCLTAQERLFLLGPYSKKTRESLIAIERLCTGFIKAKRSLQKDVEEHERHSQGLDA